ncbi:MAG: rhodanese-like domain-containing protein [Sphingobacteriales bacterium]|nr:MAG: rhodanese-like domain-containing protein [Sphingobacteriales bacterium]
MKMNHMLLTRLRLLLATLLLLPALYSQAAPGKGNQLTPTEFSQALIANTDAVILDVRTPEEFEQGNRIKGAYCINWKANDFNIRMHNFDKKKPMYIYCSNGVLSHDAAARMRELGFTRVYELKGGLQAWEAEGKEVTRNKSK